MKQLTDTKYLLLFLLLTSFESHALGLTDSIKVVIEAIDLSEDMSRVSSKNDELLLIIYAGNESRQLNEPLLSQQFLAEAGQMQHSFYLDTSASEDTKYLLVLLEMDSDKTIEQVEPVIRIYYEEISRLYKKDEQIKLEKYLGDDDLIGLTIFEKRSASADFKGRLNLDNYHYKIHLDK